MTSATASQTTAAIMERPARAALIGSAFAALMTLPGLGAGTLWDNSETSYGEVAREILLSHDWVVMHFNGLAWFIQPPLYFWLAALSAQVFGVTSLAFRQPAALATIALGGLTGYAVARQIGTRAGIYASVILSSCLMQAIVGRLAIMDALLDLAVAVAIFCWFRGLQLGRDSYVVAGCIAAGFGFLAKGPVAPVVALIVIVPYALWNARFETTRAPSWRGWLGGLLAFFAVVAPWLLAESARTGPFAIDRMIGHYSVGRYTSVIQNQTGPFWYYVPVLILGFFPWIAFVPVALAWAIRNLKGTSPEVGRLLRLAIAWALVPLVFFSFARTKLPNYVALELPALAVLVALYLNAIAGCVRRRAAIVSAATVPLFIGLLAAAIFYFARDNRLIAQASAAIPDLVAMGTAIFVGAIATLVLLCRREWSAYAPYGLGIAMLVAVDTLVLFALPKAEAFKPVPALAAAIQAQRQPGDAVGIQSIPGSNALLFYTQPRVYVVAAPDVMRSRDAIVARRFICSAGRVFVVAPKKRPAYDPTYGRRRRVVAESGRAVLFLYDGPACTPASSR
jgi:4-amino-4-deoxy-L-arabinose transferase-like glycosyltransferase